MQMPSRRRFAGAAAILLRYVLIGFASEPVRLFYNMKLDCRCETGMRNRLRNFAVRFIYHRPHRQ